MALSSLLIFWILLAGAAAVTAVSRYRPRFAAGATLVVMALAWSGWGLMGSRLPIQTKMTLSSWQVDELAWQLSGVWLLLVTAVLLATGDWRLGTGKTPPVALVLAAAGILPLLAGNLAAALVAVTLLVGVWSAVLWLVAPEFHADPTRLLPQVAWLMLSLPFLWLAATTAPEQGSGGLEIAGWPIPAASSVLTAALLLLGVWPFHGWRSLDWELPSGLAALLHTAPALAGLALLARLAAASDVSQGYNLFLTVFGLVGLLVGVRRAWAADSPGKMAAGLALAQASLAGLTLVWVGADTAVAEARVLALAAGVIFLNGGRRWQPEVAGQIDADSPIWRVLNWVGVIAALGAMAGLPLFAGFVGRAGLYAAWAAKGRFLLALVAIALHLLLATAVLLAIKNWKPATIYEQAAILLLVIGLISFAGLSGASLWGWAAILLPFAGGAALFYFTGEATELRVAARRAFTFDLPLDAPRRWLCGLADWLATAVRDAASIWEGEGGMLWLFALLIVLLGAQ